MTKICRCTTAAVALVALTAACVHVPDSIKSEFRAVGPTDRSNYHPALHGTAPPAEASDPWSRYHAALVDAAAPDAAADASPPATDAALPVPAASSPVAAANGGVL